MSNTLTHLLILSCFLTACSASKDISPKKNYPINNYFKAGALDSLFNKHIADKKMAGVVCIVSEKGKILYSKAHGYRNIEAGLLMEENSLFRLQSMEKPIISLAILKLCMQGKMSLEDTASNYFPELKDKKVAIIKDDQLQFIAAESPITISHLLSHSSGLGSIWNAGSLKGIYESHVETDFTGSDEELKAYMKLPLIDQPGHGWYYGRGHDIMANLIEKVTGKPYKEFLKEEIFQPLKMDRTGYSLSKGEESKLAQFYSLTKDGQFRKTLKDSSYTGGDDIMSTAEDYLRFCTLLLNNGIIDGKQFISPSYIKKLSVPTVGLTGKAIPWQQGYAFGLGLSVRVNEAIADYRGTIGDYGWFGGFNTAFWIDPRREIIGVVLTQSPYNEYSLSKEVKNIIYSDK